MIKWVISIILAVVFTTTANAENAITKGFNKVLVPDLDKFVLKTSLVVSLSTAQSLSGFVDGYHFQRTGRTYVIDSDNYHAFKTARDVSMIATGYSSYAVLTKEGLSTKTKLRYFLASGLIARNFFEWAYKLARYNNPFDYSKEHNSRSIVYFSIDSDGIHDMYIGTGPLSGPVVDITCAAVGVLLLSEEELARFMRFAKGVF